MSQRNHILRAAGRPALLTALLALAAGCGTDTVVSGKVTYKGTPVTGGSVTLVDGDGAAYSGTIGADGTYSIPDVPTGVVKIGVTGPRPAGAGGRAAPSPRGEAGADARGKAQGEAPTPPPKPATPTGPPIPDAYLDPRTSGLTGSVKAGEPLNIDLK